MPSASSPGGSLPPLGWVPQRTSVAGPQIPGSRPFVSQIPSSQIPSSQLPVSQIEVSQIPVSQSLAPRIRAPVVEGIGRHRRPAPPRPAILTVPMALRGVRARPRRLAVSGFLVLLVAAAVVLGVRVAWARSSAKPAPIAAAAHGPPAGLVARTVPTAFASAGTGGLPAAGLPVAASVLLVHVVGQVRRPGVVRLPPGARVLDAVRSAGGAKSAADLNHLNLARPVADGEQIVVPKPGETIPAGAGGAGTGGGSAGSAGGAGAGSSGAGSTGAGAAGGLVDLNTADATALDTLPGVGPVLSQRILDWRTEHGRFSSVDELGEVSGIGDKLLAQIGPKVRV